VVYDPTVFVRRLDRGRRAYAVERWRLVVLVVILFLQTWRPRSSRCWRLPVSIVGTFGIMYLFGFLDQRAVPVRVGAGGSASSSTMRSCVVENVERNMKRLAPARGRDQGDG